VQGEGEIGRGNFGQEAVVEHCAGAAPIPPGLADEDERTPPAILMADRTRGADQTGDVHVMTARMHDADIEAILVARADLAGP